MSDPAFFSSMFDLGVDEVRGAEDVATALVLQEVAPDAAVGWAARGAAGGWELGAGSSRASRGEAPAEPIFDLASLTKPMTAFAIARLANRRGFDRGSLLEDVLEEARNTPTARMPIELLLAHRAGLEAHLPLYEPLVRGTAVDRSAALRTAAEARCSDATGPGPFAPLYSDLGYLLAGEALARSEKQIDAGDVIERVVVDALGLGDELGTARSLRARNAVDFDNRVRPTEVVDWRSTAATAAIRGAVHDENAWAMTGDGGSGHAGMFGTVHAVLTFGCAALDAIMRGEGPLAAGTGMTAADFAWLVRPRPGGSLRAGFDGKSESGSSAGEIAGPRTFGHLGFTGTSLWIDPDTEVVVVVLTNRVHPTRENVAIRAARPKVHDALFEIAKRARALR